MGNFLQKTNFQKCSKNKNYNIFEMARKKASIITIKMMLIIEATNTYH